MRVWDADQAARFLRAVEGDRLAALWRLYVTTGLRRGEALALRWADVDVDHGFLSVTRSRSHGLRGFEYGEPKTSAGRRRVSLGQTMVAALREHRATQVIVGLDGLVFDRGDGLPLDPDGVTGAFVRLASVAGLPHIRLHSLRHSSASLMLAAGVNAKVVSERLGHSSISVTMDLYSHVAPGIQEDAAERLERAIDGRA
jgi:integrase